MSGERAPDRWRCFVAIPLTDDIRGALAASVEQWRHELDARWTDPAGWHVSLHFIGPVAPDLTSELSAALAAPLAAAGEGGPIDVAVGGLAALPDARRARVLYCAVADPAHRLERLARAARSAVARVIDMPPESRAFVPHVTLARLRHQASLEGWLARVGTPSWTVPVPEVFLMRSHLGRGPARYEALARFAVGGSGLAAASPA